MNKKVLLVTLEYPPFNGGVANYYKNIVENYPARDDIFVLDNRGNKLISKTLKWLPAIFNIKKEIKKKNINQILVGNILPLGTAVWLLTFFLKFKYSIILHGTDIMYAQRHGRKKFLAKLILKKSRNIFCNSKFTANLVKEYYNGEFYKKVTVINPGIEVRSEKSEARSQKIIKEYNLENKFVLFSISRLIKRKGVDKVIELMPELTKEIPNLVYVVAGSGPDEDELRKKTVKNVIFLGEISETDKWTWLDICDIFILPSREKNGNVEGFGIVFLEANLAGKPVIAGNHGGVGEAVLDHRTGLLVDPLDDQKIKQAILKLFLNKNLRKKLGQQGKERAMKEFDWEKQAKIIFDKINF